MGNLSGVRDPNSVLTALLVLAVFYTLYFAAPVVVPILLATLLAFALSPIVRLLERLRLPRALAAGLVVFGLITTVLFGLFSLSEPASVWIGEAPVKLKALEPKLRSWRAPMEVLREASAGVEAITRVDGDQGAMAVQIQQRSFLDAALSGTPRMLASVVAAVCFLFFLLAAGERIASKFEHAFPSLLPREDIKDVGLEIETEISRYLLTITLINLSVGGATAVWLYTNGIDNAPLWGLVIALLNFAPYIGSIAGTVLITLVALFQLELLSQALVIVSGYILVTVVEGQLITPVLVGQRLQISPYIIFLTIMLLGWMWGLAGIFMAVPILVSLKIIGANIPKANMLTAIISLEPALEIASGETKTKSSLT